MQKLFMQREHEGEWTYRRRRREASRECIGHGEVSFVGWQAVLLAQSLQLLPGHLVKFQHPSHHKNPLPLHTQLSISVVLCRPLSISVDLPRLRSRFFSTSFSQTFFTKLDCYICEKSFRILLNCQKHSPVSTTLG